MKMKIGFDLFGSGKKDTQTENTAEKYTLPERETPVCSVVSVYFPKRGFACSYYNDSFNLKEGDLVFVDGKLEGLIGVVEEVSLSFKIRISDYKRVIGKADTSVCGELFFGENTFIAFDRSIIPYEKVRSWLLPPADEAEFVYGKDDVFYPIKMPNTFKTSAAVIERGAEYFKGGNVAYLCLNGTKAKALVLGSAVYEVEFEFKNGEVGNFGCGCWCSGICKHDVAAAMALDRALETIGEEYSDLYDKSGYFAVVDRELFENRAIASKKRGSIYVSDK